MHNNYYKRKLLHLLWSWYLSVHYSRSYVTQCSETICYVANLIMWFFPFYFTYSPKSPQSFVLCWCCKHFLGHHLEGAPGLDRLQWLWAAVAPPRRTYCLQPLQQQKIRRTHCVWAPPRESLSVQRQDCQWRFLENIQQTNLWLCEDEYGLSCFSWLLGGMGGSSYSSGAWVESIILLKMAGLGFRE